VTGRESEPSWCHWLADEGEMGNKTEVITLIANEKETSAVEHRPGASAR